MILTLPTYDLDIVNNRSVAAAEHYRTGETLGRAEMAAAAHLIRKMWPTAARLLVSKDVNDDDNTEVDLLVLFDCDGNPIWFDFEEAYGYPDTETISDNRGRALTDMTYEAVVTIEGHLQDAYDAMQGTGGALEVSDDDYFSGSDKNPLELNVEAALAT